MRRHRRTPRGSAAGAALTATFLLANVGAAEGQVYDGVFQVETPYGPASLELVRLPGGTVEGKLLGFGGRDFAVEASEATDEDGNRVVRGTFVGEGMADFTLFAGDDGSFGLLLVPYDASGLPQPASGAEFAVTRATARVAGPPAAAPESSPPATTAAPSGSGGRMDARVVGVWSSQVVMNSAAGSVATQLFMHFGADGIMTDLGSRAAGGIPGVGLETGLDGGGERAYWSTQDGVLVVSVDGRTWAPLARYELSEGRLILRYVQDGSVQIWSLVRR